MNRFRRLPRLDKTSTRLPVRPANRRAERSLNHILFRASRAMGPTLIALSFAGVAHAQGTMDFSEAQTLMTTFKTILDILRKAGGWRPNLYLKIENPPYIELVISSNGDLHRINDFNYNQNQDRGPVNALAFAYSGFPLVYPVSSGAPSRRIGSP